MVWWNHYLVTPANCQVNPSHKHYVQVVFCKHLVLAVAAVVLLMCCNRLGPSISRPTLNLHNQSLHKHELKAESRAATLPDGSHSGTSKAVKP